MLMEGRLEGREKKGGRREASRGDCSDDSSHVLMEGINLLMINVLKSRSQCLNNCLYSQLQEKLILHLRIRRPQFYL